MVRVPGCNGDRTSRLIAGEDERCMKQMQLHYTAGQRRKGLAARDGGGVVEGAQQPC